MEERVLNRKTRVLIVDDLDMMRAALREILEATEDFAVAGEAVDGRDALEKADLLRPDLVVLDITMPRMDGIRALRYLKKRYPRMPVVMCSALGDQKQILRAIRGGAADYVVKPYSRERLLSALTKALEKSVRRSF